MATVRNNPSVQDIADIVVTALSQEPAALRLWSYEHPGGALEFWVLTPPLGVDAEGRLHDPVWELHDRFPELDVDVQIHIMNPRFFEHPNIVDLVPPYAKSVSLSR
jgi:hypothetical protein